MPSEREPVIHDLKIWPRYFDAVANGSKRFEFRQDDRGGFWPGDVLRLREWSHEQQDYTGRETRQRVTYVLELPQYLGGHAILSIEPAEPSLPSSEAPDDRAYCPSCGAGPGLSCDPLCERGTSAQPEGASSSPASAGEEYMGTVEHNTITGEATFYREGASSDAAPPSGTPDDVCRVCGKRAYFWSFGSPGDATREKRAYCRPQCMDTETERERQARAVQHLHDAGFDVPSPPSGVVPAPQEKTEEKKDDAGLLGTAAGASEQRPPSTSEDSGG